VNSKQQTVNSKQQTENSEQKTVTGENLAHALNKNVEGISSRKTRHLISESSLFTVCCLLFAT